MSVNISYVFKSAKTKGFSLAELMVGLVVLGVLSAAAYKLIISQTREQFTQVVGNKEQQQLSRALNVLENDLNKIDPSWSQRGIASIFPHPFLGPNGNVKDPATQSTGSLADYSDGFSFYRRAEGQQVLMELAQNAVYPAPSDDASAGLLGNNLKVNVYNPPSNLDIAPGSIVLVQESRKYMVLEVEAFDPTASPPTIKLAQIGAPLVSGGDGSNGAVDAPPGPFGLLNWVVGSAVAAPGNAATAGPPINPPGFDKGNGNGPLVDGNSTPAFDRAPDVFQKTLLGTDNQSLGYVTRAGVREGSFDTRGLESAGVSDDRIVFSSGAIIQLIEPVSYVLMWATSNRLPYDGTNDLVRDSRGQPRSFVTRIDWSLPEDERYQYLAEASQLQLLYDVREAASPSGSNTFLSGQETGAVATGVSFRDAEGSGYLGGLYASDTSSGDWADATTFEKTIGGLYRIVGLEATVRGKSGKTSLGSKFSLESMMQQERETDGQTTVSVSQNFTVDETNGIDPTFLGVPYLMTYDGNANTRHMIVPVNGIHPAGDVTANMTGSEGKLVVLNDSGAYVNGTLGASKIEFIKTDSNGEIVGRFFPNNVLASEDRSKIVVGGYSYERDGVTQTSGGQEVIQPGLAVLFTASEDLGAITANAQGDPLGPGCSVPECGWTPIFPHADLVDPVTGEYSTLLDTAGGLALSRDGESAFVASLSRKTPNEPMKIVRLDLQPPGYTRDVDGTIWSATTPSYQYVTEVGQTAPNMADVPASGDFDSVNYGQTVSAITPTPFRIGGQDYLAVCTTHSWSASLESGTTDMDPNSLQIYNGDIFLYPLYDGKELGTPKRVATHDYRCKGLVGTPAGLIVGGRVTPHFVGRKDIMSIMYDPASPDPVNLVLDEVAGQQQGQDVYADGFVVDPANIVNSQKSYQNIGWLFGVGSYAEDTRSVNLLLANGVTRNPSGNDVLELDVSITKVDFGGFYSRLRATIDPDRKNINQSAVYVGRGTSDLKVPAMIPPGLHWSDVTNLRTQHTLMRELWNGFDANGEPKITRLDPNEWLTIYNDYMKPQRQDHTTSPVALPVFDGPTLITNPFDGGNAATN